MAVVDLGVGTAESGMEIGVDEVGPTVLVKLRGSAEMAAVDTMRALVDKLHAHVCANKIADVTVDLTDLEFMSSACFKSLVTWLNDVLDLAPEARYRICFRSTPTHLWQRRSLHALQSMATQVISVETVA